MQRGGAMQPGKDEAAAASAATNLVALSDPVKRAQVKEKLQKAVHKWVSGAFEDCVENGTFAIVVLPGDHAVLLVHRLLLASFHVTALYASARTFRSDDVFPRLILLVRASAKALDRMAREDQVQDWLLNIGQQSPETVLSSSTNSGTRRHLSPAEVVRLTDRILHRDLSRGGVALDSVDVVGVEHCFPLHSRTFNAEWLRATTRNLFFNFATLDLLKDQQGAEVAFYFAFTNYYTMWLTLPVAAGLLSALLFGYRQFAPLLGLFNVAWAALFVLVWRRRSSELSLRWGTRNCDRSEVPRARFHGDLAVDDVTGGTTLYYAPWKRGVKRLAVVPAIFLCALLLTGVAGLIFLFEIIVLNFYRGPLPGIVRFAPLLVHALLIPPLAGALDRIAVALTTWENYRTETQHRINYVRKAFVFAALNAYLAMALISAAYAPFARLVSEQLGQHFDTQVAIEGVFPRLQRQLATALIVGQAMRMFKDVFLPSLMEKGEERARELSARLRQWHRERAERRRAARRGAGAAAEQVDAPPAERGDGGDVSGGDGDMSDDEVHDQLLVRVMEEVHQEPYDVMSDYVDMVLQFGFIVLFGAVWPFAALAALVANVVEMRSDAVKIALTQRRAVPARADGIGPWSDMMALLVLVGAVANAAYSLFYGPVAHTLDDADVSVTARWALVVAVEHAFVGLFAMLLRAVDADPPAVRAAVRRHAFETKSALLAGSAAAVTATFAGKPRSDYRWQRAKERAEVLVRDALDRANQNEQQRDSGEQ